MYKIKTERSDLFDENMMIAMQVTVSGNTAEKELSAAFEIPSLLLSALTVYIESDTIGVH